jgi:hypothetical protein
VSIDSTPASPTKSTSANFTYHSSEANSSFQCSVDGAAAAACGGSYSGTVANGDHTFDVWAVDQAGNQSTLPAEASWMVDTTPPVVHISSGPSGWVQTTSASFDFDSPDAGATFECHIDSVAYAPCTSPVSYHSLPEGLHTVYVRATDTLGNVSADKTQQWTVDLATHKPDAWLGLAGKFVGNDVYNSTASGQTKTSKTHAGLTSIFTIRVENDGSATDTFSIQGAGPKKGYTPTYLFGTVDDTSKIVSGNLSLTIAAGSYKYISLRVKVGSSGKASWSSLILITAVHQPS